MISRRNLLKRSGLVALGALAATALPAVVSEAATAPPDRAFETLQSGVNAVRGTHGYIGALSRSDEVAAIHAALRGLRLSHRSVWGEADGFSVAWDDSTERHPWLDYVVALIQPGTTRVVAHRACPEAGWDTWLVRRLPTGAVGASRLLGEDGWMCVVKEW